MEKGTPSLRGKVMDAKSQRYLFETTVKPPRTESGFVRLLYNQNPFYVISACLVLFGIHISFRDDAALNNGWVLFQLLGVYTILLVLSAILIVRVGAVWEDARTIIVLVLVLLVALSASFDRVCLDSVAAGRSIQLFGLAAAIVIIESLIRGVGARLAWRYKLPLYALFALLFLYPVWLGHLSLTGQNQRMALYVLLFPSLASIAMLGLLPAARMAGAGESPNGTPWTWPLYPWCGLGFITVAFAVRSYGMSVSFELAGGLQSSFHAWFLIPLALTVLALLVELAIATRKDLLANTLAACGLVAIPLALPGDLLSGVQLEFMRSIAVQFGSPVQLTCILLIVFFGYFATRRLKIAELGLVAAAWVLISASNSSYTIETLRGPHWIAGSVLATIVLLRSFQCGSTLRYFVAIAIGLSTFELRYQDWLEHPELMCGTVILFSWLIAGLIFRDGLARLIRRSSHFITLPVATALAVAGSRQALVGESQWIAIAGLAGILAVVVAYWWVEPTVRRFTHFCAVVAFCVIHGGFAFYARIIGEFRLEGKQWLAFGVISLLVAVAISLLRGGMARSLGANLVGLNYRLASWLGDP